MTMTSSKPYLLRAIYEWILDNQLTPYLLVDTKDERVVVPTQFVRDDSIVLNVSPGAVRNLELGNEYVMFSARFGGVAHDIVVPISSARMIYAKENGRGVVLPDDADAPTPSNASADGDSKPTPPAPPAPGKASHLKIVK
jgi:stringent starvation protein B